MSRTIHVRAHERTKPSPMDTWVNQLLKAEVQWREIIHTEILAQIEAEQGREAGNRMREAG